MAVLRAFDRTEPLHRLSNFNDPPSATYLQERGRRLSWCLAAARWSPATSLISSGEIAELLQVLLLLLVARRQLEEARRGAAKNVVLRLLGQERQVQNGARQIEIPVWIVRRIEQLGFRI